jgi:hypothetical protein
MITSNNNSSPLLQSAINSVSNIGTNGFSSYNSGSVFKAQPAFKMEMYKSENGGFVMNLITNSTTYNEDTKIFILNDMKNLGNDIQNILLTEILKS